MTTAAHNTPPRRPTRPTGLSRRTARWPNATLDLVLGLGLLLAVAAGTAWQLNLAPTYVAVALGLYVLMATVLLWHLPNELRTEGLGAANRVTLARSTLVLPVAALVLESHTLDSTSEWWIIAVSTIAMLMDGLDGWVARRSRSSTSLGARYDMELDAFLMLALSVLLWRSEKVGAWVVLIGLIRYLFVAAGWVWPFLRAPLPERYWRKTVCVVQGIALLVCLVPIVSASFATGIAGVALLVLVVSFGVDVRWLARSTSSS